MFNDMKPRAVILAIIVIAAIICFGLLAVWSAKSGKNSANANSNNNQSRVISGAKLSDKTVAPSRSAVEERNRRELEKIFNSSR